MTCGMCGAEMPAGLRVCGECGTPLNPVTTAAPTTRPTPVENTRPAAAPSTNGEAAYEAEPNLDTLTVDEEEPSVTDLNILTVEDVTAASELGELAAPAPQARTVPRAASAEPEGTDVAALLTGRDDVDADVEVPTLVGRATGPRRVLSRRNLLIGAGVVVACVIAVGAVAAVSAIAQDRPAPRPTSTSTSTSGAAAPAVVTLPGYTTRPTWTAKDVTAAAASGDRVLAVSGTMVTVRDARSGHVTDTATLTGSGVWTVTGTVAGTSAVAAGSDRQALVWAGTATAPVVVDLSGGRHLEARSGVLVVTGPDRSFQMVTPTGVVPVTAPGPGMIVLGAPGGTVVWAGAPHTVVVASPNGTPLSSVSLTPPASGAQVTPGTGWLHAAGATVTVIGWTLPDGTTTTGIHDTTTGALLGSVPGVSGAGLLSPAGDSWVGGGHRVDLTTGTATALPAGFVPSRFLGADLYGAETGHGDALLPAGGGRVVPAPAATVRPVTITAGVLVTLTDGRLSAFPANPGSGASRGH